MLYARWVVPVVQDDRCGLSLTHTIVLTTCCLIYDVLCIAHYAEGFCVLGEMRGAAPAPVRR